MLKLTNTHTRKKEAFTPIRKGNEVRMYACGPTVYWFAHIGNMRSFLMSDLLRRTLAYNGFSVKFVMNITDVGHLTDDEDQGEDKMLVAMRREGKTAEEIAQFYTDAFLKDLERLNMLPADAYPKATDHIPEQIQMIEDITRNGFAYETSDGVYFDTSKFPSYGQLSGQSADEKKAGARVEMGEKQHVTDFALWKRSPEGTKREMEWESPWGTGFPGWHIECTAMSVKELGAPFDIHTGGIDHIPVHHENEIAQAQGALGIMHARFWVHNEFLTVDGGRMGKSLGNLFTVSQLMEKGYDPLSYRYFVMGAHYRSKLNFTFDALDAAQNALKKLWDVVRDWPTEGGAILPEFKDQFTQAINDDLNTAQALAVVWDLVDSNTAPADKAATILDMDRVLGLRLEEYVGVPLEIPSEVQALLDARAEAREEKDWAKSDALRDEIAAKGYEVEDTQTGQTVHQR